MPTASPVPSKLSVVSPVADAALASEPSIVRGGHFYRAQTLVRLIRPPQWNAGRRVIFAIAVGWLPLVLITALFQPRALMDLLTDYKVTARMLIAVPVLILGQILMDSRFRTIAHQVRDNLIAPPDLPQFETIIASILRLRDSLLPELAIVVLAFTHIALSFSGKIGLGSAWSVQYATPAAPHLTPAAWYYTLVSQVIYQFLVGLSLWKWLLWTYFLFKLSRTNLQLMVTHPDRHAGLGFLGMSIMAFVPITLAVAAAIGATWRYEILHAGANLMSFKFPAMPSSS